MAKDKKSSGLDKSKRKKHASLSDEERALWEYAARDLKPFKGKGRVGTSENAPGERADHHAAERPAPKQTTPPRKAAPPVKPKPTPAPPELTEIERRNARRISAGRIEIEARIDLHGMRQSEAHAALRRFLFSAHGDGRRWVLVITGKGEPTRSPWAADDPFDGSEPRERGVLRRNVPRWLAEPALRSIVVGYSTAAIRHGGEGAIYVQLRRRDRVG